MDGILRRPVGSGEVPDRLRRHHSRCSGLEADTWSQRFSGGNLAALGRRGRQPRLAVIDAASVDGSRRLVLVRRDNVEHLLLIGGPTDVVIEPNIDRTGAAATAPAPVRDTKASPPLEPPPRQTLSLEGSGLPPGEPVYVEPPPPRPVREAMPPRTWRRRR